MKRENDLGRDDVGALVWRTALPSMLAQFVSVLYSIVDRMYIGHIAGACETALAGVGVCGPVVTMVGSAAVWISWGASPLMGIRMGEGRPEEAKRILRTGFAMLLAFSLAMMALVIPLREPMLRFFGASDATYPYADAYFTTYLMGTVFALLATGLNQMIIAQGFAAQAMRLVVLGAALNIALAGAVLLVILRTGTRVADTANLTVYLRVSPLLLLALSGACCAAVELGLRIFTRREAPTKTAGLELELCGQPVRLRAALDTGCHLRDPVTCLPVLLISWPAAKGRLPGGVNAFLGQWFQGLHPSTPPVGASLRVIPCNPAAQHALLPGFAVADISTITETGMQSLGRTAVAFCPQPFQSGEYEALYGSDFL
mgnify:CR=1 FL=1